MPPTEREKIQYDLLEALYAARKQVEYLQAALAHNAAFLGTGIEREDQLGAAAPAAPRIPDALVRYLGLVEPEEDISDFIGREGHDESRPRLGPDAPDEVRPHKVPPVSPYVSQVTLEHPADSIVFVPPDESDGSAPPVSHSQDGEAGPSHAGMPITAPEASAAASPPLSSFSGQPRREAVAQTAMSRQAPLSDDNACQEDDCARACLVLQTLNDGIWDWNLAGGQVYCSPRWQDIVGGSCPESSSPLETLIGFFHPGDSDNLRGSFTDLLEGRSAKVNVTVRFPQRESWGWGSLRAVSLSSAGRVVRVTAALADITAQREAETALRASNERFRAMADDSPDLISRFDREGRFLYVSPNIGRYFQVSPVELIGKPISSFELSGSEAFFEKNVNNVFLRAQPAQAEIMLNSPLAGEFLADCRFWPEFGVEGQVVSASVLVRDMTYSRRLAENYYALFNNMEDGFALFEHVSGWEGGVPAYGADEFALVVVNAAFCRLFNLARPSIAGMRVNELMGEDAAEWAACLKRVLVDGRSVLQSLRTSVGHYEISAYSPEQGRVACIVKDVTDMQKIAQEIRLNEARLAALHRLSHMDGASEESVVRYCLEQAVRLTGSAFGYLFLSAKNEGENGRIYWSHDMMSHEDILLPEVTPWIENGKGREISRPEVVNAASGGFAVALGKSIHVDKYIIAPIMEDSRIVCLAGVANKDLPYTTSDLRQLDLFINGMWFHLRRRWAVQALKKAKEEAEAASRAKNEFLANVSHELRTPLNGILGMLQVLQQSHLTEEQLECVTTANYSGRSLLRIISDILDFSRIEAGRFELAPQLFDFPATVRSTLGMFVHQAKQKNINFSLHLDKTIPSLLVGDDARVRQIIFNLVGNAFKFTKQGDIMVECSLLPRCRKGRKCIYFAVSDTGIGIPDEKLGDVFHAFTQLDTSSTRRYSGTGLGLAIVRRLVRLMSGTISVESDLGKGTTVHCTLVFEEPSGNGRNVQDGPELQSPSYPLDILVVEDDPVSQFTIRALLKKCGYPHPVCVNDGRQALEALLVHPFDCVITDIQMPLMDGMEMTRRIREGEMEDIEPSAETYSLFGLDPAAVVKRGSVPRDVPVIALTAYAMAGDRERFLGMGMDYYLAKPVNAAELAAMLAHVGTLVRARKES